MPKVTQPRRAELGWEAKPRSPKALTVTRPSPWGSQREPAWRGDSRGTWGWRGPATRHAGLETAHRLRPTTGPYSYLTLIPGPCVSPQGPRRSCLSICDPSPAAPAHVLHGRAATKVREHPGCCNTWVQPEVRSQPEPRVIISQGGARVDSSPGASSSPPCAAWGHSPATQLGWGAREGGLSPRRASCPSRNLEGIIVRPSSPTSWLQ